MNERCATGRVRARIDWKGRMILQLEYAERKAIVWKDATNKEVDPHTLLVLLPKAISAEPLSEAERSALFVSNEQNKNRRADMMERARAFGTDQIIKQIRKQLQEAADNGRINMSMQIDASVEPKGRTYDMDKIRAAFPNCDVYGNSNECASDEFSIDVKVRR